MSLHAALEKDDAVVVLGETVGAGGLWGNTAGLLVDFGPDRVRDVPVADRSMVGLALGMALAGKKPVLELSSTNRLSAVLEPLLEADAVARAGWSCTLVVRVPYGVDAGSRVDAPVGRLLGAGVPVFCARSRAAADQLLVDALDRPGPTVLLEPRSRVELDAPDGVVDVLRSGSHGTIVTWGTLVAEAMDAAEVLAADGLSFEVVDLVQLCPLPADALGARLTRTGRLVVLHPDDADLASAVVRAVVDTAFLYLESPPARVTDGRALIAAARQACTW